MKPICTLVMLASDGGYRLLSSTAPGMGRRVRPWPGRSWLPMGMAIPGHDKRQPRGARRWRALPALPGAARTPGGAPPGEAPAPTPAWYAPGPGLAPEPGL